MDERNDGAGDVVGTSGQEPEALEFVRFCHRRKHVGWPELYDEMCAVAGRGLYRGYGAEELAEIGIGLGLFQMPALAGLVARVVAEDAVPTRVVLAGRPRRMAHPVTDEALAALTDEPAVAQEPESASTERSTTDVGPIRIVAAAGA
ncbi:MAG TPA: hypothetical protein VIK65_10570 [Candidatus Limnocylindrales bacterium]|jgi:hypothetical protein